MGFLNSILFIILSITLYYQYVLHHPVLAKDVLFSGDELESLNFTSTLVSAGREFTLGFFTILSTNFTYLGTWYTNNEQGQKIWVANPDTPMIDNGVLMMDESGTLKVVNGSGSTLFSVSNQVGSGNDTRALLQDSGNFLIYDATENRTLWQSFDHPTDTLLPGMKLGYNLTTKQNWTLTSWLSDQIPSTGAFTMSLEQYQNSPHLIIYKHGEIYWTSGSWYFGTFEYADTLTALLLPKLQNMTLISDSSGMYFTFKTVSYASLTLQLSPKGQLIEFTDGVNNYNITPDFCYGYQSHDGCSVSGLLPNCRGKSDSFQLISGNWLFGPQSIDDNSGIGISDCMERCWNDCDCMGFTTNSNGTGCRRWINDHSFLADVSSQAEKKYLFVPHKHPKKKTWIWILVSVAIVITSAYTSRLCYVRIRWRRQRRREEEEKRRRDEYMRQLTGSDSFNYGKELERGIEGAPDVKIFSLGAILTATDNFSDENKLGQGGYGPVYKGKLFDGRVIAIKRLSRTSGQGIEQFRSELILISKLQHTNLVRLYGCCIHQEEKMLIYEFMPNKSLDFFLFDEDKKEKLDWQMRFNIIEGVAQGLLYLHKYSRMRVIHRDLKVSNVLLDENMNPKIADFGMAKIFQQNVTEGVTNRVVGTYGYMAPEYAMHGTFSIKSDVFSFGVLIIEIVSGKRNSSFYNYDRPLTLVGYAWKLWNREAALELKDEALGESCDMKQLLRTIHVGLLCVQENADDRPTMSEVIYMLSNDIMDLSSPKQPAFFTQPVNVRSTEHPLDDNIQVSVNGLTITMIDAR